ncbi:MAG: squalene--hopene cyclase [Acidipila sp.]|nr:squalene--hopene cyclase [Acidipila sp.]
MATRAKIPGWFSGSESFENSGGTLLGDRLQESVERATEYMLGLQAPEGYWLGELEADTTLESDYILYLHILGRFDGARVEKLANYVRRRQLPDGGWNIYCGGPAEINATVKAYFGLKLAGDSADAPHMERARRRVHQLGGLEAINSFERFYLALVGAVEWDLAPAIPPEFLLLPNWFYVNLYEMSSWSRGILVPLTILYALKPCWPVEKTQHVDELFVDQKRRLRSYEWDSQVVSWRNFFLALDRGFKLYERMPWKPLRARALKKAEGWLLGHLERSEGLAAIYPAMMNAIFALIALGHSPEDPLTVREINELCRFELEDNDTIRLQPCRSPLWDTAIAMVALEEAGLPANHPALVRAAGWLLDNQIEGPGDWMVKNPGVEPGGWAFEFRNDFYPDVDDTAFILMALQRVDFPDRQRMEKALRRGITWMVSMQNHDGGWGAFDKNNDCWVLTQVPFADHNAMIDPATADITARVIECLGRFGWPASHPVIRRALAFLKHDQCADGSWYGRWGVNYVYGTSGVIRSLEALGQECTDWAARGVAWLSSVQNADGGYGESIASYDDPSLKGKGISTASQTAWGLIGLLASGEQREPATEKAIERSVQYLTEQQTGEGTWEESEFTGTGFPSVFYLKYHLYKHYFPLYALARYQNRLSGGPEFRSLLFAPAETGLDSKGHGSHGHGANGNGLSVNGANGNGVKSHSGAAQHADQHHADHGNGNGARSSNGVR